MSNSLSACGHTFCQNCLIDWFLDTYKKHPAPQSRKFHCPECRTAVTTAPVEVYVLKDVVVAIGNARKEVAPSRYERMDIEVRRLVDAGHGCWDAFFPNPQPRRNHHM